MLPSNQVCVIFNHKQKKKCASLACDKKEKVKDGLGHGKVKKLLLESNYKRPRENFGCV